MTAETTLEWEGAEDMETSTPAEWAAVIQAAAMVHGHAAALALWYESPLPQLARVQDTPPPARESQERSELFNVQPYVIDFLNEVTVTTLDARDRIRTTALFEEFEVWAERRGVVIGRSRSFYRALSGLAGTWQHNKTGLTFRHHKAHGVMHLANIKLIAG